MLRRLGMLGLVVICLVILVLPASGQGEQVFQRLEVVFVVDQSGSMSGLDGATQANDRDGLRFDAVQYALEWLGTFRAQQAEVGNPLDIYAGLVYFGDEFRRMPFDVHADASEYWTIINAATLDDWSLVSNAVMQAASTAAFPERSLGNTDFRGAFDTAVSSFADLDNVGDVELRERLQVIVLLTDGAPCAPRRTEWQDLQCTYTGDKDEHMIELQNDLERGFSGSNRRIFAFGIDKADTYWSLYSGAWNAITGDQAERLENFEQVGVSFNRTLVDLVQSLLSEDRSGEVQLGIDVLDHDTWAEGLPVEQSYQAYDVPPFQQVMTISVFKSDFDTELFLQNPAGDEITAGEADYVSGESTLQEIWRITNPAPGAWTFGARVNEAGAWTADPNATVRIDLVRAGFKATIDAVGQMYEPVTVTVNVTDSNGARVGAYAANYDLIGTVQVLPPTDAEAPQELTLRRANTGVYEASFTPTVSGNYTFQVSVSAGTNDAVQFDDALTLNIASTDVRVFGLEEQSLQDINQHFTLHFFDADGVEITDERLTVTRFALTFVPAASGTCQNPGVDALEYEQLNAMALDMTFDQPGNYNVCLSVGIMDPASTAAETITIRDNVNIGSTEVERVEKLAFVLYDPMEMLTGDEDQTVSIKDRETEPEFVDLLAGAWLPALDWPENTVTITLEVVNAQSPDQPVGIRDLMPENEQPTFFELHVYDRDRDNQEVTGDVLLQPAGDPARWVAALSGLEAGQYTVTVEAQAGEIGDSTYTFETGKDSIVYEIVIEHNPWPGYIRWGLLALFGATLAYLVLVSMTRPIRIRMSPPEGNLAILKANAEGELGVIDEPFPLGRGRNRFAFELSELPLVDPPLTALEIRSSRRLRRNNAIRIRYELNGKEEAVIKQLLPGEPQEFWRNAEDERYLLAKDHKIGRAK
ncbi:MAG: hypothetical protein K8S97_08955 [Anaerolineae bacterium]|nr:hypothetical protein [Anaerolineae bacterium]